MKINKNFSIPLAISVVICMLSVIIQKTPLFLVCSILLFLIVPILVIQQKSKNDWGQMFVFGIILTIVYVVILIIVFSLANHYEWLKDIVLWPYKWRES